ncbi:MAG: anion permease [Candidatus Rokubacteria bacterium]|nr:anion permease [Candidatus Rokubacteria bacterium]
MRAGLLRPLLGLALPVLSSLAVGLMPAPAGLSPEGQRVLAVIVLAIGLWGTEALPPAVTAMVAIVALVLSGAVPGVREGLAGFADPIAYFLIGVLTIGLAVSRSGLAERAAHRLVRHGRGEPGRLYVQLLLSFPLLTLMLPSATTRTGILVHVYDQALRRSGLAPRAPLARAVMLALNSVNRLSSTVILTGGITPVVAAGLMVSLGARLSWSRWFVLMAVPYAVLLGAAGLVIALRYWRGFGTRMAVPPPAARVPLSAIEVRAAIITAGASLLWLGDAWHHWHPTLPALLAWVCLLAPGIGVLGWRDFERGVGWTNFFVIASSLSLAQALGQTGASAWLAGHVAGAARAVSGDPVMVIAVLLVSAAGVRLLIPNITGFLATTIPVAMSVGIATGVNPLVCGLVVTIAGDAVLYYPAQSASSLVVYERGHLSAGEIFAFGLVMTVLAGVVVLAVALPYWALVGEPLLR